MIFKIFIMHYTPLKERFNIMNNQLKKENVPYEFIREHDREKLTEKELQIFDTQKVKLSMCSNISKHILTYQKIINSDYNYNLILEDDVIILDNFKENLNKYLEELPKDYDMLFIGNGCNLHIKKELLKNNKHIYLKDNKSFKEGAKDATRSCNGSSRCTDSYVISKKCCQKILEHIKNINENKDIINKNSDWWLNNLIRLYNFKVYWAEPTIVTQGTQNGTYNTSH